MKTSKLMLPVMTLGLAVGLAFAHTTTVSNGWIDLNGTPTQLSNDPCTGSGHDCTVRFEDDPEQRTFEVYTDMSLTTPKPSGVGTTYVIPGTP